MRILSWNVNSVRLRLRALSRVLETHRPDVVCLQETKVEDLDFPPIASTGSGTTTSSSPGRGAGAAIAVTFKLNNVVTHTPVERRAIARLTASLGWVDAVRFFHPAPWPLFTWWSYRAPDWRRVNKGRRLDHAWVTPALAGRLAGARVLDEVRGWRRPSDHAPLLLDLDG
jgi:exonuclease III